LATGTHLPTAAELSQDFAFSQGRPFCFQFVLNIAGGKINAYGYGIVILGGKLILNVLSVFGNAQYQFALVMQFVGKLGIVKRRVCLEQGAFGLHKNNRLVGDVIS
jgi:hypothetical protein